MAVHDSRQRIGYGCFLADSIGLGHFSPDRTAFNLPLHARQQPRNQTTGHHADNRGRQQYGRNRGLVKTGIGQPCKNDQCGKEADSDSRDK